MLDLDNFLRALQEEHASLHGEGVGGYGPDRSDGSISHKLAMKSPVKLDDYPGDDEEAGKLHFELEAPLESLERDLKGIDLSRVTTEKERAQMGTDILKSEYEQDWFDEDLETDVACAVRESSGRIFFRIFKLPKELKDFCFGGIGQGDSVCLKQGCVKKHHGDLFRGNPGDILVLKSVRLALKTPVLRNNAETEFFWNEHLDSAKPLEEWTRLFLDIESKEEKTAPEMKTFPENKIPPEKHMRELKSDFASKFESGPEQNSYVQSKINTLEKQISVLTSALESSLDKMEKMHVRLNILEFENSELNKDIGSKNMSGSDTRWDFVSRVSVAQKESAFENQQKFGSVNNDISMILDRTNQLEEGLVRALGERPQGIGKSEISELKSHILDTRELTKNTGKFLNSKICNLIKTMSTPP